MPLRNFRELEDKMEPARVARAQKRTAQLLGEMPLQELRTATQQTQQQLAAILEKKQAEISKIEHRADMYVSTLTSYIEAMGGRLDIVARFPDGDVRITQFRSEDEDGRHNGPRGQSGTV